MSKARRMVQVGWIGPNGVEWRVCATSRVYRTYLKEMGMPSHIGMDDPIPARKGQTVPSAGDLDLSGQIPSNAATGLKRGDTARPMSFVDEVRHDGTNPAYDREAVVFGQKVSIHDKLYKEFGTMPYGYDPDELVGSTTTPTVLDKLGYRDASVGSDIRDLCAGSRLDAPVVYVVSPNGNIQPTYNKVSEKMRTVQPDRFGNEPDFYYASGEKRAKQGPIGPDDMNRTNEGELLELQRITKNLCRSRDMQRSRQRSDIGRVDGQGGTKADGADMWDAAQDSVITFAEMLRWVDTLAESYKMGEMVQGGPSATDVATRTTVAWWFVPASAWRKAAEADELGEEYDPYSDARTITKKGIMWQAARKAVTTAFDVQDREMRMIVARFVRSHLSDTDGEIRTIAREEVEYTQEYDNGTPGHTFDKPAPLTYSSRKPHYVGTAELVTSTDNPYNEATFRAAWEMTGKTDILGDILTTGMHGANLNKRHILATVAQKRYGGAYGDQRNIKRIRDESTAEWHDFRDNVEIVRGMTSRVEMVDAAETRTKETMSE